MTKELIESSRQYHRLHTTAVALIAAALVVCLAVAAVGVSIGIARAEGLATLAEMAKVGTAARR